VDIDEAVLDDPERINAADPGGMLLDVASSGAQVRAARTSLLERDAALIGQLRDDVRPRAVVFAGVGGSGVVGAVVSAVTAPHSPIPVVACHGYSLPAWIGPLDVVVAVSCSGHTEETLAAATQAVRRGARLVAIGSGGSPLAALAIQANAPFYAVDPAGRSPRASLWSLLVPALGVVDALGLSATPPSVLASVADRLDAWAADYGPRVRIAENRAKVAALALAGMLPVVWGSSEVAGVAAHRFSCQLAENAKYPSLAGTLPEANHNQIVFFDGALAGDPSAADLFRDRVDDPAGALRLSLVLLRDTVEHPQVARRRSVSREVAEQRGIPVMELVAEGEHPMERLASLLILGDYVSVYVALCLGEDPSPIGPIDELKARIAD
jgi:glucose/mannose-6-phosphate isomerase